MNAPMMEKYNRGRRILRELGEVLEMTAKDVISNVSQNKGHGGV